MTTTSKVAAGVMLASTLGLLCVSVSRGQDEKKVTALPNDITWNLKILNDAPLKVVSTRYDPKTKVVLWIFELARDLNVYEDAGHWGPAYKEGKKTRFRFELQDVNGIVLQTVDGRYVGEYVTKAGKRFGALLALPLDLVSDIKTVEAVPD